MEILITILMFAYLVFCIIKKYDIRTVLFFGTILGFLALTLLKGSSIAGDDSIGNSFLDIFETINSSMLTTLTGNIATSMMLFAYMQYMKTIKAADMFAALLSAPAKKIKNKYLVAAFAAVVGVAVNMVVSSAVIIVTLTLATLYPVLRRVGCSKETSATAIMIPVSFTVGPARATYYIALSLIGVDASVPIWFVRMQLPVCIIMLTVILIIFVPVSRYFDKKEGRDEVQESSDIKEATTIKDLGVPVYYALLPLIPIVLVVLFSDIGIKSIIMRVVAACLLSWLIAFIIDLLSTRKLGQSLANFNSLYDGMGRLMKDTAPINLFGTTFANAMLGIGGVSAIVSGIASIAGGIVLLIVISILGFLMVALTGSFNGNLALVMPIVREIITITGINPLAAAQIAIFGLAYGGGLCPISAPNMLVVNETKTKMTTLMKRLAIPLIAGNFAAFAATYLLFA